MLKTSGLQEPMAESKKAIAAIINPFFLPRDFEIKPAAAPPITQPINALAITKPLITSATSCNAALSDGIGFPINPTDQNESMAIMITPVVPPFFKPIKRMICPDIMRNIAKSTITIKALYWVIIDTA